MTKYLISFPSEAMAVTDEEMPQVSADAHAVIEEAKAAGVYVFGGGINEQVEPVLIAGDTSFDRNPLQAYAHAWALSFYLSETQPREYTRYLVKLAALPEFQSYPPAQRLADFQEHFGKNLRTVETQFRRYLAGLK